jgi:protein SCO1/2
MVLALVLAGTLLAGCHRSDPSQPAFKAIDITGAEYARGFDLPDADGLRRHLADFGGKVVVVFFGYTHCPDVCPTTLAELAAVKQALGADGAQVQGIFVTIDPARDTPELLKNYVSAFSPDFIALRGTPEETRATARSFKVYYAQVPGRTEASYTMDHTAGSYIFDRHGAVRLFTRYGSGVEALTHDLRLLLAQP